MSLSHPESIRLTREIIGAAIEVHRHHGPGLLESAYDESLYWELSDRGMTVDRQRSIPLVYKTRLIRAVYRPDMIVNRSVLVEIKAVEKVLPVHRAQLLTYLKMTHLTVGLLFNFNEAILAHGISRVSL